MACRFIAALVLFGLLQAVSGTASAERRVALVIGNGAYQNAPQLPNPKNDAEDVAAALKRSGFETITGIDADQSGMQNLTIRFARAAREADVALFYYSGHALQHSGINYLMPVDAKLADEADLRRMARVDEIVADLQQAKSLRILVLDACRDNPLAEGLKRSIGRTRAASITRGLAPVESAEGMIVAFSTQSGHTADDGEGRHSPYTAAFLKHFEETEEIGRVFRRISADVYATTNKEQLPELSLSLIGEFYLRGRPAEATPQSAPLPESAAERAWKTVKDSKSAEVFEAFLKDHPDGLYAALARAQLKELQAEEEKRQEEKVARVAPEPARPAAPFEPPPAPTQERWAALAPNQENTASVVWGSTKEEAKRLAVLACKRVSSTCADKAASTNGMSYMFAVMCCNSPRRACAVGTGADRAAALAAVEATFSNAGFDQCSLSTYFNAGTGEKG